MRLRCSRGAECSKSERGRESGPSGAAFLLVCAAAFFCGPALAADSGASDEDVRAAEALVRARYYEGIPEERARDCSEPCAARLLEMLADPAETASHANILYVLARSSHPGAHAAIAAYAAREPAGEVSGAVYNARVQLLLSLGERARRDPRALRLLVERLEQAEARTEAPRWWVGPLRGEALREVMVHGVMRGLALSGTPEAGARLRAREAVARGDERRLAGLREALELHQRVALGGEPSGFDNGERRP